MADIKAEDGLGNSGNEGKGDGAKEEILKEEKKAEPQLPKLTPAEFRAYNTMAEHMEYFVRIPPHRYPVTQKSKQF